MLVPQGPLTHEVSVAFARAAEHAVITSAGRVGFDLSRVAFVDSDGLEALVTASRRLSEIGHAARVIGANEVVREVMEITGVAALFHHYATAAEAAGALG